MRKYPAVKRMPIQLITCMHNESYTRRIGATARSKRVCFKMPKTVSHSKVSLVAKSGFSIQHTRITNATDVHTQS